MIAIKTNFHKRPNDTEKKPTINHQIPQTYTMRHFEKQKKNQY